MTGGYMYQYRGVLDINYQDKYQGEWTFGIRLKSGAKFKVLNCYLQLIRGNDGRDGERLLVDYLTESKNKDEAKTNIENSLNFLSYLTEIPLEEYYIDEAQHIEGDYDINVTENYKKIRHVEDLNNSILNLNQSEKKLFYHNLKLLRAAQKYHYVYGFSEDSFINFFKIIENIATAEYESKEKLYKIDSNKYDLNKVIEELLENNFNIKYPDSKIKNITKSVESQINKLAKDGVFFNISIFARERNIPIDQEILHKAIKVRNKISHGDYVKEENIDEVYSEVAYLAYNFISYKFLNHKYKDVSIDSIQKI